MNRAIRGSAERNNSQKLRQHFWRDPALPFVEIRKACQSRACYKPHAHPTFSIGVVDGGSSIFMGAGGTPVELHPGALVFVPAERVHACNPALDSAWSYQMMHLDSAWLTAVREEYAALQPKASEPIRVVLDPALYSRFCVLSDVLFSEATVGEKEGALIEFVGDYDLQHSAYVEPVGNKPHLAEKINAAQDHIRSRPEANVSLPELAAITCMSRYQLIRAFRAVTGMTPHAWQLNLRINLARNLMHKGDSIVNVANHLGFADQAHFQRVFKAYTGVTPGSFRG